MQWIAHSTVTMGACKLHAAHRRAGQEQHAVCAQEEQGDRVTDKVDVFSFAGMLLGCRLCTMGPAEGPHDCSRHPVPCLAA